MHARNTLRQALEVDINKLEALGGSFKMTARQKRLWNRYIMSLWKIVHKMLDKEGTR